MPGSTINTDFKGRIFTEKGLCKQSMITHALVSPMRLLTQNTTGVPMTNVPKL